MTEFEYDCYRKKNIAHSAMRRKCGSKSKKCNLSTDHMTHKQWSERCGEVMSYNIGKPMDWAEFCRLPKDLKEEYLNNLIQKFSANARTMADIFGVSTPTIFRMVKKESLNINFLKGRHPSGEKEEALKRFLNGDDSVQDELVEIVSEPTVEGNCDSEPECSNVQDAVDVNAPDVVHPMETPKTRLDSFTMNFSGEINVDMIANSLRYILASCKQAKIQIICELV